MRLGWLLWKRSEVTTSHKKRFICYVLSTANSKDFCKELEQRFQDFITCFNTVLMTPHRTYSHKHTQTLLNILPAAGTIIIATEWRCQAGSGSQTGMWGMWVSCMCMGKALDERRLHEWSWHGRALNCHLNNNACRAIKQAQIPAVRQSVSHCIPELRQVPHQQPACDTQKHVPQSGCWD